MSRLWSAIKDRALDLFIAVLEGVAALSSTSGNKRNRRDEKLSIEEPSFWALVALVFVFALVIWDVASDAIQALAPR